MISSVNLPISPQRFLFGLWLAALWSLAAALVLSLVFAGFGIGSALAVGILAVLAIGLEREGIGLYPGIEVSVASLVCVFAAVVYGPLAAIIVGAAGHLADLPRRDVEQPVRRWATWTGTRIVVAGSAGLAATAVLSVAGDGFLALSAAVGAAVVVDASVDLVLASVTPVVRGTASWTSTIEAVGPAFAVSIPLHVPMVAVLVYAYTSVSPWSVALFAAPALAAQRLLLLYRQQRDTASALGVANERLSSANLSFATALVATLDARDQYTAGHSAAVAIYARDIAARMGLSSQEQELIHLCGLVHDVGKIGLPAGVLEKKGPLTLEERRQMERHSEIGERILRNVDDYAEIAEIVRHHHERVDGNGYPDKLKGDHIPLLARIIAVADAYNAMTSHRPYRDAMPSRVARLRLAQAVESQFDTAVVAAFEAILTAATEGYRMATEAEFDFAASPGDVVVPDSRVSALEDDLRLVAVSAAASL